MSIYPECSAWRHLFAYRGLNSVPTVNSLCEKKTLKLERTDQGSKIRGKMAICARRFIADSSLDFARTTEQDRTPGARLQ